MKFPEKPLWNFVNGFFVSTADTFDAGLETMVFPASANARICEGFLRVHVKGVDFEHPIEEYTRHYETVKEARAGHREIVAAVKRRAKPDDEH